MKEEILKLIGGLIIIFAISGFAYLFGLNFHQLLTYYCFWGVYYLQIKD